MTRPGPRRPVHECVGSQPLQPRHPGLLPAAAGRWKAQEAGPHSLHAQAADSPQLHAQASLTLAQPDSGSRWSFLSTSKTVAFLGYPTLSPGAHTTSKLSGLLHLRCVPFWLTVYIDDDPGCPTPSSMPGELERAVPPRREQCVGCSLPLTTQDYGRVRLRPPSRSSNCCSNQAMWAWMRGRRALAALPRRFFSDTSMATS